MLLHTTIIANPQQTTTGYTNLHPIMCAEFTAPVHRQTETTTRFELQQRIPGTQQPTVRGAKPQVNTPEPTEDLHGTAHCRAPMLPAQAPAYTRTGPRKFGEAAHLAKVVGGSLL